MFCLYVSVSIFNSAFVIHLKSELRIHFSWNFMIASKFYAGPQEVLVLLFHLYELNWLWQKAVVFSYFYQYVFELFSYIFKSMSLYSFLGTTHVVQSDFSKYRRLSKYTYLNHFFCIGSRHGEGFCRWALSSMLRNVYLSNDIIGGKRCLKLYYICIINSFYSTTLRMNMRTLFFYFLLRAQQEFSRLRIGKPNIRSGARYLSGFPERGMESATSYSACDLNHVSPLCHSPRLARGMREWFFKTPIVLLMKMKVAANRDKTKLQDIRRSWCWAVYVGRALLPESYT